MAIKVEAFTALDESLALRLSTTLKAVTSEVYSNIQKALDANEFDEATRLAYLIDTAPVFYLNEAYIAYVSRLALLFGASRVTSTPGTSAVGLGFGKTTVTGMIESFKANITLNVKESLINHALQLIATRRSKASTVKRDPAYLGTVLKALQPSAVLPFASFMDSQGKAVFNMVSGLHSSRLAAFGYTAEADILGITYYQINEQLDGRTCPVCSMMHGKVFKVQDARNLLDIVVRTQDPDELKSLQPWPSQSQAALKSMSEMPTAELVARGWHVPPFHPRCRGLLTKAGKTPRLTNAPLPVPPEEVYVATPEDFNQLGIKLSTAKIDLWNSLMTSPPSQVVADLTGTPLDSMLLGLMSAKDPAAFLGLETLSVTKTGINIELKKQMFGSKKPVLQDYYFRKDQSLFVGSVEIQPGDEKVLKPLMQALYGVAKGTKMSSISMVADKDIGGFALAKYGLTLSDQQWSQVKNQIKRSKAKQAILEVAPPVEKKAFDLIMASNDPKDLFALSDLPTLGKAMLSETQWVGRLKFDDPESVSRFVLAMGATA